MARHRRKKISLYEAMTQTQHKHSYGRVVERLHPEKQDEDTTVQEKSDVQAQIPVSGLSARWRRKPRMIQFNIDRIDFSVSYPVAAAIALGIILLFLLALRAGQYFSTAGGPEASSNPIGNVSGSLRDEAGGGDIETMPRSDVSQRFLPGETKLEAAQPIGTNVIVLVEYSRRADLMPVQRHFARYGIETEIVNWDGKYFLITKDLFEGFGSASDGEKMKRKIAEVGALYKGQAPEGYETFAPKFFSDAYGKKVK